MKANKNPSRSKRTSNCDFPVLQSNDRRHQLECDGWREKITLNQQATGVALFFGGELSSRKVPIYLANATGARLCSVFGSDAGFIDFNETHEDTLAHVRALGTIDSGTGSFLDTYLLDLGGDFLISYSFIATSEEGVRYHGSASIQRPPDDGWIALENWAPIQV
ncbi:hypothetical protein J5N58_21420 [Rhizobium cremeum]|uniref:hypothetical protein n=1 Tax=Rhizobium cremeum TaxID=2813827 RepID=UPI001FD4594F|nr:hypothetical protein [Rhizobium cremeum]MCJ7997030.1 hypothetical protein [Rhizobium cremeum]MCJ8002248.1 hypothetical protein [Rhizobium cremeum]